MGLQEIRSLRNLGPEKYGPQEIWFLYENHHTTFSCGAQTSRGPNFLGPKFLRAQISQGPNFLETQKVRGLNEMGNHFSYSRQATVPSLSCKGELISEVHFTSRLKKKLKNLPAHLLFRCILYSADRRMIWQNFLSEKKWKRPRNAL